MRARSRCLQSLAVVLLATSPALQAERVPIAYQTIARSVGVPDTLLYAIALQESRLTLGKATIRPWPWTLNIAGSPKRFRTHSETVQAIEAAQADGITNIDVGIMQVNLHYHGERFEALTDAVHPYTNILTGAAILREAYEACDANWWCATGRYHSYRESRAADYQHKVRALWTSLDVR